MSLSVHKNAAALLGGRLAFERAIRRSGLPAPARHVALTVATWADIASGVIPERFQPSLSTIAEATGMGVTTVKRHLSVLEQEGWLLRDRPEIALARREHARTKYALTIPPSADGHGPERTMPKPGEGHAMGQNGPGHSPEETGARSAAGHKSPCSSDESPVNTTTSPAGQSEAPATTDPSATDEDGGGGSISSRSTAEEITAALDYRGRPPDKRQRQTITDRLTAALDDGWTLDALAVHLDLGTAPVNYAAGVYMHRLQPENLDDARATLLSARPSGGTRGAMPTAEDYESATLESVLGDGKPAGGAWEQATERARQRTGGYRPFECPPASAYTDRGFGDGTDGRVAGWMDLSRKLPGHKPYTNDAWSEPADPAAAAKIPHCGDWDCDPRTRLRDHDEGNGLKSSTLCPKCHPGLQW